MNRPTLVSFITPVCNQGEEARLTVENARRSLQAIPHEIIVVDDNSVDGSCHGMPKDVLVVRTPRRDGVSSARRCGFEQSRGDVLIWSDPHCRFPGDSLEQLALLAAEQEAVVQPRNVPEETSRVRFGGRLELSPRGLRVARSWHRPAKFPALYGTIYAMQRRVYERLGGWPKLPGIWSYSEQALTLMAYFLNMPIIVDPRFTCVHKSYHPDKRFPFSVHQEDRANNAHFVHAAFFPETYAYYWKPLLEEFFGAEKHDERILSSRDFCRVRRQLRKFAVRTEESFYADVLGVAMPTAVAASAPSSTGIVYRGELPQGATYERQQSRRSRPKEYIRMRRGVDRALRWMCDAIGPGVLSGKTALDAGTRDGYGIDALQAMGLGRAEGVELVEETVKYAQGRGRAVRQADMARLPHADGSFDLVTCIHALEHCPQPLDALRELGRVLRPGGWLYVVVPEQTDPTVDTCHNCAFPTIEVLTSSVLQVGLFEKRSLHWNRGSRARRRTEFRLLLQRL